jgi:ankyrin repeat protein
MLDLAPILTAKGADLAAYCWNNNMDFDGSETPLDLAASLSKTKFVTSLIDLGANVNAVNLEGESALFFAARSGNGDTVATLLDAGANVNAVDNKGRTPLDAAGSWSLNSTSLKLLLAHGAVHGPGA